VRRIAEQEHLVSAHRHDSQGICFLGKINYNDYIRHYLGECPGDVVDLESGRLIGRHRGLWFHTIGQRKGMGFSGGPWFVVKKDVAANILYVSHGYDPQSVYRQRFTLLGMHWLTVDLTEPTTVTFKIRHTADVQRALAPRAQHLHDLKGAVGGRLFGYVRLFAHHKGQLPRQMGFAQRPGGGVHLVGIYRRPDPGAAHRVQQVGNAAVGVGGFVYVGEIIITEIGQGPAEDFVIGVLGDRPAHGAGDAVADQVPHFLPRAKGKTLEAKRVVHCSGQVVQRVQQRAVQVEYHKFVFHINHRIP
jgi:hypothetical protein